ncbi:MAG: hypothetical protein M1814_003856 [Vezdaea aestivalis]|nr:MAG: hypothetical protein M1814_003856 [Vezdaea aestivalis]
MSTSTPHLIFPPPRSFPPRHLRTHSRSPSRSPVRLTKFFKDEMDPLLTDLSPHRILELLAENVPADLTTTDSQTAALQASIARAGPVEREFGARAALAAKKLRDWCKEVEGWDWPVVKAGEGSSKGFEGLGEDERGVKRRRIAEAKGEEVRANEDTEFWGSLPAETVKEYERRVEEIEDDMEHLDVDELKIQVLDAHSASRSKPSSSHDPNRESFFNSYTKLDDFTALTTATVLQALPNISHLESLLSTWTVRISVLQQIPRYLRSVVEAQNALQLGWNAIRDEQEDAIDSYPETDFGLTQQGYDSLKVRISDQVTTVGRQVDRMLDGLEGREETVPEGWIDQAEAIESDYGNWAVRAQRRVLENDWRRRQAEEQRRRQEEARLREEQEKRLEEQNRREAELQRQQERDRREREELERKLEAQRQEKIEADRMLELQKQRQLETQRQAELEKRRALDLQREKEKRQEALERQRAIDLEIEKERLRQEAENHHMLDLQSELQKQQHVVGGLHDTDPIPTNGATARTDQLVEGQSRKVLEPQVKDTEQQVEDITRQQEREHLAELYRQRAEARKMELERLRTLEIQRETERKQAGQKLNGGLKMPTSRSLGPKEPVLTDLPTSPLLLKDVEIPNSASVSGGRVLRILDGKDIELSPDGVHQTSINAGPSPTKAEKRKRHQGFAGISDLHDTLLKETSPTSHREIFEAGQNLTKETPADVKMQALQTDIPEQKSSSLRSTSPQPTGNMRIDTVSKDMQSTDDKGSSLEELEKHTPLKADSVDDESVPTHTKELDDSSNSNVSEMADSPIFARSSPSPQTSVSEEILPKPSKDENITAATESTRMTSRKSTTAQPLRALQDGDQEPSNNPELDVTEPGSAKSPLTISTPASDGSGFYSDVSSPQIEEARVGEYFLPEIVVSPSRQNRARAESNETTRPSSQMTERAMSQLEGVDPFAHSSPSRIVPSRSRASSRAMEPKITEKDETNKSGGEDEGGHTLEPEILTEFGPELPLRPKRASVQSFEAVKSKDVRNHAPLFDSIGRTNFKPKIKRIEIRRSDSSLSITPPRGHNQSPSGGLVTPGLPASDKFNMERSTMATDFDSDYSDMEASPSVRPQRKLLDFGPAIGDTKTSPPPIPIRSPRRAPDLDMPPLTLRKRRSVSPTKKPAPNSAPSSPTKPPIPSDPLQQKISSILTALPAKIQLTTEAEARATVHKSGLPQTLALTPPAHHRSRLPRSTTASPSFALSPAPPRSPFPQSTSTSTLSSSHGPSTLRPRPTQQPQPASSSDIQLYHLHRPTSQHPIKLFVRLVGDRGERVMVRVGGGWADLAEYLRDYALHHGRRGVSSGSAPAPAGADGPDAGGLVDPRIEIEDRVWESAGRSSAGRVDGRASPWPATPASRPGSAFGIVTAAPAGSRSVSRQGTPKVSTPKTPAEAGEEGGEEKVLGMAGPKARRAGDMSSEKRAWVEGVMGQVRKASAEKRERERERGKEEWGELGKVEGVRRVYRRGV